jgi:hypothetical protein
MRYLLIVLLAVALAACDTDEPGAPTEPDAPPVSPAVPAHELEPPEGVDGATSWVPAVLPEEFDEDERFASPEALLEELARLEGERDLDDGEPEVTSEVIEEDEEAAVGRIVVGGVADDAIYGDELLVEMASDGEGWYVTELWTRVLCRRGTETDACL